MSLSRKSPERQAKIARSKERWRTGETNLQKSALWIKKKMGYTKDSKGILSRQIAKLGSSAEKKQKTAVKKGDGSPADKSGIPLSKRITAQQRNETFKRDRKIKDKGQKSYNKGKPKSEWVDSAYERRQADAKKATQEAARKKQDAFNKKHKRGKYNPKNQKKRSVKGLGTAQRIGGRGGFSG